MGKVVVYVIISMGIVLYISILNFSLITVDIKIGDYLQMGKYYDEPILWRCVDIDENGPLMLSDKIITIKAYDAGCQGDGSIDNHPA